MVGNEGFEPPMPDSESGALPLGEFPVFAMRKVHSYSNSHREDFLFHTILLRTRFILEIFGFLQVLPLDSPMNRIFSVYCQ
jgi:hypothetical protein